ncbi:periplasmic heavy metal sensor [Thioclava sp. BHET1]|nr:periplasmic heavy metal sensor [Thioclava sp. BHET1]
MAVTGSPSRRLIRWVLIGSVTLNLLVIGVIIGGIFGHDRHPPRMVVGDVTLGIFTKSLSPEDREALRQEAQKRAPEFRAMRMQARADLTALIGALKAQPWDRAEVKAILTRHQDRMVKRVQLGDELIFERFDAMSVADRRDFADRLQKDVEQHEKRRVERRAQKRDAQ